MELNPSNARSHYNLGPVLLKMGMYRRSVDSLSQAIRINPQSSDAFYNLAAGYANLGEKENASKALRRPIELNPTLAAQARKAEDFGSLRSDPEFFEITRQRPANPFPHQ